MATKTLTPTEEMIQQLNNAEEVMAALDQAAGKVYPIASACARAYEQIGSIRDSEANNWNSDPEEEKIYRCMFADSPYHTDDDGPCDVWSTSPVCGKHVAQYEKQQEERGRSL